MFEPALHLIFTVIAVVPCLWRPQPGFCIAPKNETRTALAEAFVLWRHRPDDLFHLQLRATAMLVFTGTRAGLERGT